MKIHFRDCCYLSGTSSFLWIEDTKKGGNFLTIVNSVVEVIHIPKVDGVYQNERFTLRPYTYDFYKAVTIYDQSTLSKTPEAKEYIQAILTDTLMKPKAIEKRPDLTAKNPDLTAKQSTYMTLAEIAKPLGIDPALARKIARSHLTKPSTGWGWNTSEEIKHVHQILESNK